MATTPKNPFSYAALIGNTNLQFAGVDQGIDFTGKGTLYALAPGEITRVVQSGSGWPGTGALVVEKLTGGPQAGQSVYYAEDLSPAAGIAVGKVVRQGDVLATATGSGLAPGVEVGFAQPSGIPVAPLPPPRPASQFTPQGASFLSFVEGTNVSLGVEQGNASAGILGTGLNQNANSLGSTLAAGAQHIPGVVQGEQVVNAGQSLFKDAGSFFAWIGNTQNWIRIGEIVGGSVLMLVGVVVLTRGATSQKGPVKETAQATRTVTRTVTRRAPARRPAARPRTDSYSRTPQAVRRPPRTSRRVANARYDTGSRPGDRLSEEIPF